MERIKAYMCRNFLLSLIMARDDIVNRYIQITLP